MFFQEENSETLRNIQISASKAAFLFIYHSKLNTMDSLVQHTRQLRISRVSD